MSSTRRSMWPLIVVLVAIAVGVAWYLRRGTPGAAAEAPAVRDGSGSSSAPATGVGHAAVPVARPAAPPAAAVPANRGDARVRRDALREQIVQQLAQRPAPPHAGSAPPAGSAADPPTGGLRNRAGSRQVLVDQLNRDFMPLASECIEQAQQRSPELAGMLAIGLETIADDQLGAVVDVADPAARNQVGDPLLFECLRESAFGLSLPPPPTGGREKFEITIPVEPGSGSGSGAGTRP